MSHSWLALCSLLTVLALSVVAPVVGKFSDPDDSAVSFELAHSSIRVHASSFSAAHDHSMNADHVRDVAEVAAAFAAASREELHELSDHLFHKAKFSLHGSRAAASTPASFSLRSLAAKHEDKQFFVHFSVRSDVRTLAALHKFTGHRVITHIEGGLYVAIGDEHFAAKARRFPGVSWVQEREPSSKLGSALQQVLRHSADTLKNRFTEVVAECWYDGCGAAASAVISICPDVYVHPTLVEAHCSANSLPTAVSLLSEHVGVDHIDVKPAAEFFNFGGRAIVGTGPNASTPEASLVLSRISVNNSIIAVADSGIDTNNCFFYDNSSSRPWNNSRVLHSYNVAPCEQCGRCCTARSGSGCTNELNACGNFVDQNSHGTHVSGTVAGAGPAAVAYGNGIAAGAKIFFQDIEYLLNDTQCFAPGGCVFGSTSAPTDLLNLFQPAYNAGARVHTNSWGDNMNSYTVKSRAVDSFTSINPTFIVLFAAGNGGLNALMGSVSAPATCKNCLSVGSSQLSDAMFRSIQPFVDGGSFCDLRGIFPVINDPCCSDSRSCIDRCCEWASVLNFSLSCCASAPTCVNSGSCSVQSGAFFRSATNVAASSSRGPTSDGRFKPDLVVPGDNIISAATPTQKDPDHFIPSSPNYCGVPNQAKPRSATDETNRALNIKSGTSMATPLMAGAVEKIRQYFVQGYYPRGIPGTGRPFEPAEALVRAVVLASCQSVFNNPFWALSYVPFWRLPLSPDLDSPHSPNIFQGFGLPVLDHAVFMADSTNGHRMHYVSADYSPGSLATAYNISCDSAIAAQDVPLTLALVWTDPAGHVHSQKQLVNDLDLIVIVPGSTPSQLFGNMRSFADQVNTVERVVTSCPTAGFVTAIVAPGDLLKTSSQTWFLVANGPLKSEFSPTSVPTYSKGRSQGPVTQSQCCFSDTSLRASVQFKPSSVWTCFTLRVGCTFRQQEFIASLAQIVGVAVQGIQVISLNASSVSMVLACSATINTWQSATATTLNYVSPMMLFAAIQNVSSSLFEADQVLNAFDWSTLLLETPPPPQPPRITMSITAFTDSSCQNMSSTFLSAPNPFIFTNQTCVCGFGPIVSGREYFFRATSCDTSAAYTSSPDPSSCSLDIPPAAPIRQCSQFFGPSGVFVIFDCAVLPAPSPSPTPAPTPPPTPPPATTAPSGASSGTLSGVTSPAVIAFSVIGAVASPDKICVISLAQSPAS